MGNPAWNYKVVTELNEMTYQIEKYAHRRNVILGITKASSQSVETVTSVRSKSREKVSLTQQ